VWRALRLLAALSPLLLAGGACNQSDFAHDDAPPLPPDGPGTPAWGEESVACNEDSDCHSGEVCKDSICQMQRCSGDAYESVAPLGERRYFFRDRELAVADSSAYQGGYWADGYAPQGGNLVYPSGGGSWNMGGQPLTDIAGGNYLGERPELVAAAVEGSRSVVIGAGSGRISLDVGFVPKALAAGDVDRDRVEELIVLGAGREVAVCRVPARDCDRYDFSAGVAGVDVAAADVDGDGYDEPVFALLVDGQSQILAWNVDAAATGQPEQIAGAVPELLGLAAGDLDADGKAEVVALEDGGWLGWASDKLHVYSLAAGGVAEQGVTSTDSGALDLTVTDLDNNKVSEVAVLRDDQNVDVLYQTGPGQLGSGHTSALSNSNEPTRITTLDFDGDSPAGHLVEGPALVPGAVVPTMVLYMPPYYRHRSNGLPWLWVGDAMNSGQALSDTVSLSVGVTVGYEGGFPGVFEAELAATLGREVIATRTHEVLLAVGDQFNLEANPDLYGEDYAAVVLSCGCFHSYTYELEDPAGQSGGNGRRFVILMPVGGQTTLWSSKRYNAMAQVVGGLPTVTVPHRVGDPMSYPRTPQTSQGQPIAATDLVFRQPPTSRVSDVGDVGWTLTRTEEETNEVAVETTLDLEGAVNVGGFKLGGNAGVGWGQGYAVTVGTYAEFLGGVPPLPDDPATPEDEYATYAYSFTPLVYREHYTDGNGKDAAYYVLNFAVGF